jgi:hypothetical protein
VRSALEPVGTHPDSGSTILFVTGLYVSWLQGSRAGIEGPPAPFEEDLIRAAFETQFDPETTEYLVTSYRETRRENLDLVYRLSAAHARAGFSSDHLYELFSTTVEALASMGIDVRLGRTASDAEKQNWEAASGAVLDAFLKSATRVDTLLGESAGLP